MGTARCTTQWSLSDSMQLLDYGCYCGLGGSEGKGFPRNHIDKCCKWHDWCYHDMDEHEFSACGEFTADYYTMAYEWTCENEPQKDGSDYWYVACQPEKAFTKPRNVRKQEKHERKKHIALRKNKWKNMIKADEERRLQRLAEEKAAENED